MKILGQITLSVLTFVLYNIALLCGWNWVICSVFTALPLLAFWQVFGVSCVAKLVYVPHVVALGVRLEQVKDEDISKNIANLGISVFAIAIFYLLKTFAL